MHTPTSTPSASSAAAAPGPTLAACSAVAAPAMATTTTGVAIPSLSPLSTLSSRRILAGTAGFTITPAPRAASVGARAAPTSRASQMLMPWKSASASRTPRPIVRGSPIPSSRRHRPTSARRSRSLTRDASENRTRTRVISASAFTSSEEGAYTLSSWVAPPSEAAAKERIAKWSANQRDDLGFAIETLDDPPVLVGHIGLWGARPKDRCATLGIALGREHIGRGYGTDAMRVIVGYGFREMGLHRIQLGVAPFNPAGIRAYEKAGFTEEGRL